MSEKKFLFKREEKKEVKQTPEREIIPWTIAIIDDDEQVHQITTMVLKSFYFDGRPLSFLHAYSEAEGYELFKVHPDAYLVPVAFPDYEVNSLAVHEDNLDTIRHLLLPAEQRV